MGKNKKQSTYPKRVLFDNGIDKDIIKGDSFISSDLQSVMEGVAATTLYYPCQDDNQQLDEQQDHK